MKTHAWLLLTGLCLGALAGCSDTAEPSEGPVDAGPGLRDASVAVMDAGRVDAGLPDSGLEDAGHEAPSFEARLAAVEGLEIVEVLPGGPGETLYSLHFTQPEDHTNPSSPTFGQRLVLRHRDEARPLVVYTTGYHLFGEAADWADRQSEPAGLLGANELIVEHRFFGASITSTPAWSQLTVRNSAVDTHRVVQALRPLFPAPMIATGISKGGMTAIFHARHFPEDYALVMPYVAPISFGVGDARYVDFVSTIGPEDGACRQAVRDLSIAIITRREALAAALLTRDPELEPFSGAVATAIAWQAIGFEWSFWQRLGSPEACAALPAADGDVEALLPYATVTASTLDWSASAPTLPYQYQASTELGSPDYDRTYFGQLLWEIDFSLLPPAPPAPWPSVPPHDPAPMRGVDAWLRGDAANVLGVYGAWDPWTGGMPTFREHASNLRVIVPEIGHRAQLALLPPEEKAQAYLHMEEILGWPVREPAGVTASPIVTRHRRLADAVIEAEAQRMR